jgi:RNA polymerase sigma factor (sigma-70 family)
MARGATADDLRLRELSPQVLAAVVRRFRDFGAAEDAVQEALVAAAQQWPEAGVPDNPRAWLIQVASRRLTDHVRSESARRRRETTSLQQTPDDEQIVPAPDSAPPPEQDDTLLLLFMSCHPALTRPSAIALTLRAVGGLTTAEIANAFLVPEATMAQRISRAKQTIRASGVRFAMPDASERTARLGAVLHVLYLIFNEGYANSVGPELLRVDLANEAIRLARAVHALAPEDGEVAGLLALMLLTAIEEGVALVSASLARGAIGSYQLQAAIAALHDEAGSTETTDWPQILALYGLLARMSANPMITLNRAIALAMVHGPQAGLAELEALDRDERLAGHYRLHAVRGHLHERLGEHDRAVTYYQRAADGTASTPERDYLRLKASRLARRGTS